MKYRPTARVVARDVALATGITVILIGAVCAGIFLWVTW